MRPSNAELIRIVKMAYPVAERGELVNRQLINGSRTEKLLFYCYYNGSLFCYNIIESIFWIFAGMLLGTYAFLMLTNNISLKFHIDGYDPVTGGTRPYAFGGLVWAKLKIVMFLSYTLPWYKHIIKKL